MTLADQLAAQLDHAPIDERADLRPEDTILADPQWTPDRLEDAIRERLSQDGPAEHRERVRACLEIVQRAALTGVANPVRAWFARHEAQLRANDEALGVLALGALAMAQPARAEAWAQLWLELWRREESPNWWGRAFIGLRRQDLARAAAETPLLVNRLGRRAGPLLEGLWSSPGAEEAMREALRDDLDAREVVHVLAGRLGAPAVMRLNRRLGLEDAAAAKICPAPRAHLGVSSLRGVW